MLRKCWIKFVEKNYFKLEILVAFCRFAHQGKNLPHRRLVIDRLLLTSAAQTYAQFRRFLRIVIDQSSSWISLEISSSIKPHDFKWIITCSHVTIDFNWTIARQVAVRIDPVVSRRFLRLKVVNLFACSSLDLIRRFQTLNPVIQLVDLWSKKKKMNDHLYLSIDLRYYFSEWWDQLDLQTLRIIFPLVQLLMRMVHVISQRLDLDNTNINRKCLCKQII